MHETAQETDWVLADNGVTGEKYAPVVIMFLLERNWKESLL
jgi:hypothetical protein